MNNEMVLNRPEPLAADLEVVRFTKRMDPRGAVEELVAGNRVLVHDFYSSGLLVSKVLRKQVDARHADGSYAGQRTHRAVYRELSQRLLLRIKAHRLTVRKAPEIGWFRILYPDTEEFLLPFGQVQGLNSAWQWWQNGISIPVLPEKIHPFYGTYFPTRFEHLELFDRWLDEYDGKKTTAIDIGVGSGVITYQLLQHGFGHVDATDSNPNAIHGMQVALESRKLTERVNLWWGDLFAGGETQADLIVFNPPWLPLALSNDGIDRAMYYDETLFPRFFAEAAKHLGPGGRLVLLFSNLAQITDQTDRHPIEEELKTGDRFVRETLLKSKVKAASKQTRRNQHWRDEEQVELWVLRWSP